MFVILVKFFDSLHRQFFNYAAVADQKNWAVARLLCAVLCRCGYSPLIGPIILLKKKAFYMNGSCQRKDRPTHFDIKKALLTLERHLSTGNDASKGRWNVLGPVTFLAWG